MEFLGEPEFNAIFGSRVMAVRKKMKLSRPQLAYSLGITKDQLKRYETRPSSGFPLCLLPQLIFITGRPYTFWLAPPLSGQRAPLSVVESS